VHSSATIAHANTSAQNVKEEMSHWITGTSAILIYQRHGVHDIFTLPSSMAEQIIPASHAKEILSVSWNINNSDDLRASIANLIAGRGHNQMFMEFFASITSHIRINSHGNPNPANGKGYGGACFISTSQICGRMLQFCYKSPKHLTFTNPPKIEMGSI
jgi:hypothetical protein